MIQANDEQWRDVPGYEGAYQVSNTGRVRSLDRITEHPSGGKKRLKGKIMKVWGSADKNGIHYPRLCLTNGSKEKTWLVHVLVAKAFIPNPENKPFVNHKDGNKLNAHADNLEWVTCSENMRHAYVTGLNKHIPYYGTHGQRARNAKLRAIDAMMIRIMWVNGYSTVEMSRMFGVHRITVGQVIRNKNWTHLPPCDESMKIALTGTELNYQP